jgi:DNA-binding HxlR family transcriptional regulator
VLDIIANKWTVLIIGALSNGTRRFQQLRREVDGVTQKMLTQTLRALERDELVGRRIYATVPPRSSTASHGSAIRSRELKGHNGSEYDLDWPR